MSLSLELKNSVVADKLPAPSQLGNGEIALNYNAAGPFLTCKDTAGKIRRLHAFWCNSQAPSNPSPGLPWIDISGNSPVLKVWVSDASQWAILSGVNGDILPITTDELADAAVTTEKLAPAAVTADRIATGAVSTDSLAEKAVTGLKLADQAVNTAQLATGAVGSTNLADGAVTSTKLGAGSVKSVALSPSAVITAALADASVTSGKIAAQAVISTLIANGAVGSAQLATNAVQSANLAAGAVSTDKLADGGVTTAKIAAGAVNFPSIDPGAVQLSTETWTPSDTTFPTTAAVQAQLDADPGKPIDTAHIQDLAVTTAKLADQAVNTAKLKPGAVTFSGLNAAAVVTSGQTWSASDVKVPTTAAVQAQIDAIPEQPIGTNQILDGAVTNPKLAADAVGKANVLQGSIDITKLDPSSVVTGTETWANVDTQLPTAAAVQKYVTNLPKGPINTGDLASKAVTAAKIADGAIGNLQLGANVVAFGNLASGAVLPSTAPWTGSDVVLPTSSAVDKRVNALIGQQVIQTANLADLAVTTAKLALGAVTNPNLAAGAVQFANFSSGLVSDSNESWSPTDTQIPTTAAVTKYFQTIPVPIIGTANLADEAVTNPKLGPEAVTNSKIRQGTIKTDRISTESLNVSSEPWVASDATLATSKAIQANLETTLEALQIDTAHLADYAVTDEKLGNSAVTTVKLADAAVTTDKLAPSAVGRSNLSTALVNTSTEDWNPSDLVIPTSGAVDRKIDKALENFEITTNLIANEAVTTAKLAPLAVTADKVALGAITFGKLATNTVLVSGEPWDSTDVTIPTTASTSARIQERLSTWTVNTEQIGDLQVTTEKIADQAVTAIQIADLAVGTNQIADESVTPIKLDREYVYGPATKTHLGGIKVGANLLITADGVLSAESGPGGGLVDTIVPGAGIQVDGSSDPANPIVSALVAKPDQLGSIIVGENLAITPEGVLSATAGGGNVDSIVAGGGITVDSTDPVNPKVAVKVGESLTVDADGTLEVNATAGQGISFSTSASNGASNGAGIVVSAAPATPSSLGAIKVGSNLSITEDGTLSAIGGGGGSVNTIKTTKDGLDINSSDPANVVINLDPASTSKVGGVKVGTGLTVTPDGTLNAVAGSPRVIVKNNSDAYYVADANDINTSVIFYRTNQYSILFLDGDVVYPVGAQIKIITSTSSYVQVVPINGANLESGFPAGMGRRILTQDSSLGDKHAAEYANLIHAGNGNWLLRGPTLELGAPWQEYVGRVDGKWSPGKVEVRSNAQGEDMVKVWNLRFTATPFSGGTPVVVTVNKNARSFIFPDLEQGKKYSFTTEYAYKDNSGDPTFKYIQCVNPLDFVVDSQNPSSPTGLTLKGFRGARAFIDFFYDQTTGAPWDFIEARCVSSTRQVLCDWVKVCTTKDPSPDFPYYYVQFWPDNTGAIGNNTTVQIRLCRNSGEKGSPSAGLDVDWDANLIKTDVNVAVTRGSTNAIITWNITEDYKPADCKYSIVVKQGEGVLLTQFADWNDKDGITFSGNANSTYTVFVTPQTYGRSNITTTQEFKIPSPFRR
jgi:hypothetical protein